MRIRGLTLGLVLLSGLAACDSHSGGAITVAWAFPNAGTCSGAAVDQVQISIGGESLQNDTFDCRSNLATFSDFYPGAYNVTVVGLDSTGASIWSGTGSVRVDGDASVTVVLQPLNEANAVTYFTWTLDPASGDPGQIPLCGAGQVLDKVAIFIDDMTQSLFSYDCDQGANGSVVVSPYVTPGHHTVVLLAFSSQENTTAYAETDALDINFTSGQAVSQTVPLHWNVGGLQVGWAPYASMSDYDSDTRQSCSAAGIADLVLGFQSTVNGQPSFQSFGVGSSCNASVTLNNVYTGSLTPYIDACGPGGTPGLCGMNGGAQPIYREDPALVNPPTVTVQPGVFFQQSNAAPFQVFIPLFHI